MIAHTCTTEREGGREASRTGSPRTLGRVHALQFPGGRGPWSQRSATWPPALQFRVLQTAPPFWTTGRCFPVLGLWQPLLLSTVSEWVPAAVWSMSSEHMPCRWFTENSWAGSLICSFMSALLSIHSLTKLTNCPCGTEYQCSFYPACSKDSYSWQMPEAKGYFCLFPSLLPLVTYSGPPFLLFWTVIIIYLFLSSLLLSLVVQHGNQSHLYFINAHISLKASSLLD